MIDLTGVSKVYPVKSGGQVVALDGVNLHVDRGSIHGIVGRSGAGKSTLIRCLTALEKPTEGHIVVDGLDLSMLSGSALRAARRRIGMVFQAANLLDARTAADNIGYPLKLAGVPRAQRRERVEELLELVGLEGRGDSYPSQLSGGQRQRVGIARALADNPAVLLCDEPTSALDTESTAQILSLLRHVRDVAGVTVVIITHEMAVVREICDSVTLLGHGQVLQTGPLEGSWPTPRLRSPANWFPCLSLSRFRRSPPTAASAPPRRALSSSTSSSRRTRACLRVQRCCTWPRRWAPT